MNEFFSLEPVASGVWAAISNDPVRCMSNAGIVDLGDRTLVWDTFVSVDAATALAAAARQLTGRDASLVLNSHHHLDHTLGNAAFPGATVVSSATTRDLMAARFERLEREASAFSEAILNTRRALEAATHPWERQMLSLELGELEMLADLVPRCERVLPTLTFDRGLELHGSERRARVLTFGPGHTGLDAVLLVDGVLFAGDLVLVDHLGFAGHGDAHAWTERLGDLAALEGVRHLVPGHGPVAAGATGSAQAIASTGEYLRTMLEIAARTRPEDIAGAIPPEAWQAQGLPASYRANLETLVRR